MKQKRLLIFLLVVCLMFAGCTKQPEDLTSSDLLTEEQQPTKDEVSQADPKQTVYRFYYDSSDSFHPFYAKTKTHYNLFPLVYDGLIKVSPEYTVEYKLAKSVRIKQNICRIRLNDAYFSDGSRVTPEDVVYSFELAKAQGSLYSASLADAAECTVQEETVVITLERENRFFVYNLDFPIIKKESGEDAMPIGCGRYVLQKNGNAYHMVQNDRYPTDAVLPDIELTVLKSNDSMLYAVKTDSITAYAEDSAEGTVATIGTWTASTSLSHLVYLGINHENTVLAQDAVRKAMLCAIDSNAVLTQGFGSQGVITGTPINPWLTDGMEYDFSAQGTHDVEQAKQLLEEAGYRVTDSSVRKDPAGKPLAVSILVNKNNSSRYSVAFLIGGMLEAVGFSVEIERVSFDEYTERIETGDFSLYIGETAQTLDCALDIFTSGSASYSIGRESNLQFSAAADAFFASGKGEQAFFDTIFHEVPMIPLFYRNGLMIYSKSIENKVITAPHDIFYNIEQWL